MAERKSLNLRDMRFLVALANVLDETGSLTKAELVLHNLGFVFADLSKEMKRIELEMGFRDHVLIKTKSGSGAVMTALGRKVAARLSEILDQYKARVEALFPDTRKRVTLGMTNSATTYLLSHVLKCTSFLRDNPQTDLKVLEGEAEDLQYLLRARLIDFAVGQERETPAGIIRQHFCDLRTVLLYKKNEPRFAKLGKLSKDPTYREEQLLQFLKNVDVLVPLRRVMPELERWLENSTPHRIIKLPQAAIRREWAKQGLGLAVAHLEHYRETPDDDLAWVELPEHLGKTRMCFYFHGKHDKPEPMSAEAESLVSAIRQSDQCGTDNRS
jgi:DNA-binding transcriptional LysR family regulator